MRSKLRTDIWPSDWTDFMEGTPLTAKELRDHLGGITIKRTWDFILTERGELFHKNDDGTWFAYPSYEEAAKRCSGFSGPSPSGSQ
jgi:hypothetical protein